MNKLFTKVASICLGLAMAVGVGVAVASNSKEATPVHAANATWNKITDDPVSGNSYLIISSDGKELFDGSQSTIDSTSNHINNSSGYGTSFTGDHDDKVFTFTKSGSDWYIQSAAGTYIGRSANSNGITTSTSQENSVKNTITNSSGVFTIKGTESRYLSYNSSSGRFRYFAGGTVMLFEKAATKTLSSITLSGYTTEFTVGDNFSFGGTVTAHYSNSTTATVTASTTFSGYNMNTAGNYTVTASYTEGGVTKTATYSITVSAPSTPFITPAKSSTSGYTGTNESLSFTYGNLTGSLSVASSNTSVVTVGTPSISAGSGTVQINFVAEGSTTVKFKDGSTELASVSVSVSDPTVTITGMPSARSIATGATLDLGSLITVTPTGNLSSDVTWSTSNSSFASVTQSGVVTGEAVGSATITVTPDDYAAGAVSCTVTVANVMTAVFGTTGSNSFTEVTDASKYKTDYSYTIDTNITLSNISKVYPQTSNALKFGNSSVVGSMTFSIPSTIDSKPVYITSVTVRAVRYNETKGTTMLIGGVEKTLTYSADDYTADLSSGEVTSFVLTADSSSSDKRMYVQSVSIQYAFKKTLSSIALSGSYQTTFTKGGTFNHDGLVVTATYSDSSIADVTSSATFSGYNLSNIGNQTVTVSYTEGTTKTATYSITVNYAAVTSVALSKNSAGIGLNETFDYTQVTVTVSPSTANPSVTWSVSANTVGDDYVFDGSGLSSKNTAGTITLKCESNADSSKYATLVVTVTGDPTAAFDKESTSGYAGKTEVIGFTYGNMDDVSKITVASSNTSYVSVEDDLIAEDGVGLVTINFVAEGSANVTISYNGGSALDTVGVTVSADSVTALTWSAPTIKVYSGATTTVSDASSWNVHYTMASGDEDDLSYGEYTLKLGGSAITLPHTWSASEDGKVLSIEYGGFTSPTTSTVDVIQTLQAVMAPVPGEPISSDLTFTEACGGSGTSDKGQEWTVASDGTESTYDPNKGIHYGTSGASVQYIKLSTSDFSSGTITKVVVQASTASGVAATVSVKVGGAAFGGDAQSLSSSNASYTFTGSAAAGEIEVLITKPSSATKAIYCKGIEVTYSTPSGESVNIANVVGHEAAQKAVVAFAKAMNAAFDNTANCTVGVADAWATASSAYSSNITNNASLSADEKAYAKNLIKYASAQYTKDTDNDYSYCLERAMATYEACIQKHGQTPFMSDVRSLSASSRITSLSFINGNDNTVAIIVIISMISVTAIGGCFFLRKRKEN